MNEDENLQSTPTDEGAGNQSQTKDAEGTSQEDIQGQESVQSSVGNADKTSSDGERQDRKGTWNQARFIEKTIRRELREHLTRELQPVIDQMRNLQTPDVPQKSDEPDFNNLSAWIKQFTSNELKTMFGDFKGQVTKEMSENLKMQEARNYLESQQDIGKDYEKQEEVADIMKKFGWDFTAVYQPLRAVQLAVEQWRKEHSNPNRPQKATLSGVPSGSGTMGKKELSVKELIELQKKISSGLPIDEKEKLESYVDSLMQSA